MVVGLIGPNGAGKSTALRLLAGQLAPSTGSVRLCGVDLERQPLEARRAIGYMPENAPLYGDLRVEEQLALRVGLRGIPQREAAREVARVAGLTGLSGILRGLIRSLSAGVRRRVAVADALIGAPPVLLLDEPTARLDPVQREAIGGLLSELSMAHAVVVSTHLLEEAERLCSHLVLLDQGQLCAEGSLRELMGERAYLDLWVDAPEATALSALGPELSTPAVVLRSDRGTRLRLALPSAPDPSGVLATALRSLSTHQLVVLEVAFVRGGLRSFFRESVRMGADEPRVGAGA